MGFRGKYKNKRDANEPEIFTALTDHGIQVYPTDQPLDAIAAYNGYSFLVEVKNGSAPLTKAQKAFLDAWEGHAVVLRSTQEANDWAQSITAEYGLSGIPFRGVVK